MLYNLVAIRNEKYKDAQQSIYNFLKLEAMQEKSTSSKNKRARKMKEREIRWLCHERRVVSLELDQAPLITSISQICQSTKGSGYW